MSKKILLNRGGPKHSTAEDRIAKILHKFYFSVTIEVPFSVPNPHFIHDPTKGQILTYWFDVFAQLPKSTVKYEKLGVEIDGEVHHKKTKKQYIKDKNREESLTSFYDNLAIVRFDSEELAGKGYLNPKTKQRIEPLAEEDILLRLGLKV